jgi:hypothetical protein
MISTLICCFDYQNQDFQVCFLKYQLEKIGDGDSDVTTTCYRSMDTTGDPVSSGPPAEPDHHYTG